MSYDAIADAIPAMTYEEQLNLLTTLVEAIKTHIPNKQTTASQKKTDYTDSYPPGYFDLFGSVPSYPEEPEELSWKLESKKEFF